MLPFSKWDIIMRSVQVSSYIPGRIRLYSKRLIGNAGLCRQVYAYISSYHEIDSVEVNVVTGSVLIKYQPGLLRTNHELAKVEQYVVKHIERR